MGGDVVGGGEESVVVPSGGLTTTIGGEGGIGGTGRLIAPVRYPVNAFDPTWRITSLLNIAQFFRPTSRFSSTKIGMMVGAIVDMLGEAIFCSVTRVLIFLSGLRDGQVS